jgi:hypothetical protein
MMMADEVPGVFAREFTQTLSVAKLILKRDPVLKVRFCTNKNELRLLKLFYSPAKTVAREAGLITPQIRAIGYEATGKGIFSLSRDSAVCAARAKFRFCTNKNEGSPSNRFIHRRKLHSGKAR